MADITAVNIGDAADDGTGDPLRTAFDKLNDNDEAINTELALKANTADLGDLAVLNAVTFAEMPSASAGSKLVGRGDGGAGDFQEITIGSGLSMSGTTISAAGAGLPTDDTNPLVQDPVDTTKRGRIDVGAVATETTRAIIMGDRDVNLGSGGTFAELSHTHGISSITELAATADQSVLANFSGGVGPPEDVDLATFKAALNLGALADLDTVSISDISASGTPSGSTFLRGDGQWTGIVANVEYQTIDIDDATTLTASHAKFTIVSGNLRVTKLRLRNSSDQSDPVTVTMPDSDAVSVPGVEFDLIQADDQTGTCTIQRETNGTINGETSVALAGPRATAVLIIDGNAEAEPVARLEGETDEARTIEGATTFSDAVTFNGAIDINAASTLDHTLTLGGSAAIVGADKVVSAVELKDIAETYVNAGNKSAEVSFDYSAGGWQKCVATANISSVAITNPPATGRVGCITLEIHQDGTGNKTIAWGEAFRFPGGAAFTLSSGASDIDIFTLATRDGGTTWYVFEGGKDFAA